jgi:hypothetical protein
MLRVLNLPDNVKENDIEVMFNSFGPLQNKFLAIDPNTGNLCFYLAGRLRLTDKVRLRSSTPNLLLFCYMLAGSVQQTDEPNILA